MAVAIKLPDMGTNVEECTLNSWRVKVGDPVKRGEILAEIETDKATAELESTAEGVLLQQVAQAGQKVSTGDILAFVGQPGEVIEGAPVPAAKPSEVAPPAHPAKAAVATRPTAKGSAPVSPVVRNLAEKMGVSIAPVQGTGQGGMITREDVLRSSPSEFSREFLLSLYRQMVLIRQFEERVKFLFLEGIMPGTIHQYQGQEAVAVGVCSALKAGDVITSTHRPHGHALARGLTAESILHELFGKTTGCCRGKGGSMHVGDLEKGMAPAIAIVAGAVPMATGFALAFKMKREPRVAVCFVGDGAVNEGAFHEGVNMGAVWSLPVVYVIENNLYSASTPIFDMVRVKKLADRATAYGMPGLTVDGNDVIAVHEAARQAVERARHGDGPTLIECMTYRITGHSRRDPCNYQPEEERKQALEKEPIRRFSSYLETTGVADQAMLDQIRQEVDAGIEQAVKSALAAPDPAPEDALEDLMV